MKETLGYQSTIADDYKPITEANKPPEGSSSDQQLRLCALKWFIHNVNSTRYNNK